MSGHSVLVVTSCTGLKAAGAANVPAERLYTGEQHRRLMEGVQAFRAASTGYRLELRILSAGLGLVAGSRPVDPYDRSFASLPKPEIDSRAEALGIPGDVQRHLSRGYALVVLLLGDDYMRAASVGQDTELACPTIAFTGARLARHLQGIPSLKTVPLGNEEARRFSCGLVGLKGELGARLLRRLAHDPSLIGRISAPALDLLDLLETPLPDPLEVAA